MATDPLPSNSVINALLAQLFQGHGAACVERDGWIVFPANVGVRVQGEAVDVRDVPTGRVLQLDVRFEAGPGKVIVESFGGFGEDGQGALGDAMTGFARGTLHVLLGSFLGLPQDELVRERWKVNGLERSVIIGDAITKGAPQSHLSDPCAWFSHLRAGIESMQLTPGVHWVRMFHAEAQGSTTANEALVDNVESVDLQSHMADFAWPRIEAYCSTRLFLLLQDQLDVSQALATMAQWSTTNEDRMRAALVARGASASHAEKLVCLVPLAFGRPILARLGVSYSDTAVVIRRGDQESTISLLDEPIYVEALRLAQSCGQCGGVDPTLFRQISVLSAEIDAVNNALSAGVKVENMRFKPLVLYWSEAD